MFTPWRVVSQQMNTLKLSYQLEQVNQIIKSLNVENSTKPDKILGKIVNNRFEFKGTVKW